MVKLMENARVAAMHIEDQIFNKRCGHRPKKKRGRLIQRLLTKGGIFLLEQMQTRDLVYEVLNYQQYEDNLNQSLEKKDVD